MKWIVAFGRFWYDFIVGDDWMVAGAVVAGVVAVWLVARTSLPAWPLLPLVVAAVLGASVWRVWRDARGRAGGESG